MDEVLDEKKNWERTDYTPYSTRLQIRLAIVEGGRLGFSIIECEELQKAVGIAYEELRRQGLVFSSKFRAIRRCLEGTRLTDALLSTASTDSEKFRAQVLAERVLEIEEAGLFSLITVLIPGLTRFELKIKKGRNNGSHLRDLRKLQEARPSS